MFFYFGKTADSWAIGNDVFSLASNLPAPIQQIWDRFAGVFSSQTLAGTAISWISTAPDGAYAIMIIGGKLLSNKPDILAAAQPTNLVEHISLSPLGGWFIRFSDGTVQISPPAGFSQTFCSLVGPYLDHHSRGRQYSSIRNVFFGSQGAIIVQTEKGLMTALLPPPLKARLHELGNSQDSKCVLGKNTVFCHWDPQLYLLEVQSTTPSFMYLHQFLPQAIPDELASYAKSNQRPSPGIIDRYQSSLLPTKWDPDTATRNESPPPPPPPPRRPTRASFTSPSAPSDLRVGPSHHRPSSSVASPSEAWGSSELQASQQLLVQSASIPSGSWNSYRPEIPAAARTRYERQFHDECNGKQYLTGIEAAGIFFASGLGKSDLSRIWEETDRDQNGRFDKDEFVQAMWLIELSTGRVEQSMAAPSQWQHSASHQPTNPVAHPPPQDHAPPPYQSIAPANNAIPVHVARHVQPVQYQQAHNFPPQYHQNSQQQQHQQHQPQATLAPSLAGPQPIEILVAVICQGCGNGLGPNDCVYRSLTQYAGVHYYCTECHRTNRCPPAATLVRLVAGKSLAARNKTSTGCGGCWTDMKKGEMTWHCKKCWDKDLCQKCWGQQKRHCKHAAQGQVLMMRVGREEGDPWSMTEAMHAIRDLALAFK